MSKLDSSTSKEAERKAKEAAKLLRTSLNKRPETWPSKGKSPGLVSTEVLVSQRRVRMWLKRESLGISLK